MGKCTYDTVLGRKIMLTIPLQVLVSMGWFAIHLYTKGIIYLWCDHGIKKKYSPILLITFNHKLYTWINTVYMIQKKFLMSLLLDDPSVIHTPIPKPGVVRGRLKGFSLKMFHIQVGYYQAYRWPHSHSFNLFIELILKREACIMQTEPQKFSDILYW